MPTDQNLSQSRITAYRLLSDLFARPASAEQISQLANVATQQEVASDPCLGPLFARFQMLGADPNQAERDLTGAYAFLFLGAGGPHSVPPCQSPFVDAQGLVCQAPAAAMAKHLRDLGMHVDADYCEPADHIAVILAVVAQFIATGKSTAQQAAFLNDHLAAWLPDFRAACARNDHHGFYAQLARTAEGFVTADLEWLGTNQVRVKEEEENV